MLYHPPRPRLLWVGAEGWGVGNLFGVVLSAARREETGMKLHIKLHALHSADEKDVPGVAHHILSSIFPQKEDWVGHNFLVSLCNPNFVSTVASSAGRNEPYQLHFLGMCGVRFNLSSPVFKMTERPSLARPAILCRGFFHLTSQRAVRTVEEVLVNRLHHELPAQEFQLRQRASMFVPLNLNSQAKKT